MNHEGGSLMNWTQSICIAIDEMEKNLLQEDCVNLACRAAAVSPLYLQQGFHMMTGLSMTEYVRCRRLYKAALELANAEAKVLNVALKYGWDSPESFTKAFSRFHGFTPMQVKKDTHLIRPFLPLQVSISIQGGNNMHFTVEKMDSFQLIGFSYPVAFETSYQDIPKIWDELMQKHHPSQPETPLKKAMRENGVGEFAVCLDEGTPKGTFQYMIAGRYQGGEVPEGMQLFTFPALEWAKFPCTGPLPGALQSLNTKIFREWLPGNSEYRIAMGANIEWYNMDTPNGDNCETAIWVPVERI